jgi:hypothetical protein
VLIVGAAASMLIRGTRPLLPERARYFARAYPGIARVRAEQR